MAKKSKHQVAFFAPILFQVLAWAVIGASGAGAATIVVVDEDSPGKGLNDPAPFASQGGNGATTLGEARLQAVQFAASLLGNLIDSPVPIRIGVRFDPLGGTVTSAPLGEGRPVNLYHDFPGAPRPNTWYPAALANKLAGQDLDGGTANEIELVLNSDVDGPLVLGAHKFYYGFDAAGPAGDPSLVAVVVHELLHCLGFSTPLDLAAGAKLDGMDDVFELHLERTGASPPDFPSMTDAQRLAAFTAAPAIHWVGTNAATASAVLTAGVAPAGKVEMYAPAGSAADPNAPSLQFRPRAVPAHGDRLWRNPARPAARASCAHRSWLGARTRLRKRADRKPWRHSITSVKLGILES